jgi:Trypsin-like peptidase domain
MSTPTSDPGPIGDLSLRRELAEHMNIVRSYTHAIVIKKKGIGTGVAFRLGERLFLVTAGHNLDSVFEVALFVREGPAVQAEVLNSHFHPESRRTDVHRDVGFVEIRNVPSLPACRLEQLHVGPRTPRIPKDVGPVFIAGCPESGFLPQGRPGQVGLAVISGYPHGGSETTLEIEYERSGHAVSPDGSSFQETDFFATPRGFSGGGVWVVLKPPEGELFLPHKHVLMCGTQFQWDEGRRVLQAMRTRFSVPYFFECYPGLRAEYGHVLAALSQ